MRRHPIIYGLFDPRNGELRYVGKASNGLVRCLSHVCPSSLKTQTLKNGWIKSLLKLGLKPEPAIIEEVGTVEGLDEAEMHHIAAFRALGCRLTNMTKGGDGQAGVPCSPETREKIAAAQRGKPRVKHTTEWRILVSSRLKGRKRDPGAIERTASKLRGQKRTPEQRAKFKETTLALWRSPEYALKLARAHGGVPFVDQHGRRYETLSEAATAHGLSRAHICSVLSGKRKHTGGFIFTKITDDVRTSALETPWRP